jgi:hypothetical protein
VTAGGAWKAVESMSNAELLEEARRREANRLAGRPLSAPAATVPDAPDTDALEDEHYQQGDKLIRALGGRVYSSVQKRRARVSPGWPDRKYFFPRLGLAVWWEAKSEDGKQRSAQREFQEACEACGEAYVLGTYDALCNWLVSTGHFEREGALLVPRHQR